MISPITPSLLAVMVRRRPFFQEDPLISHATRQSRGGATLRGALIGRAQAQKTSRGREKHHEAVLSSADRIQAV